MAYSKDEIKQITDKVLNMCKADAVEVRFSGGERSATRFANSSITANLIEHDQEVTITVRYGQKTANATTHQTDDDSLKRTIDAVQALARRKPGLAKPAPAGFAAGRDVDWDKVQHLIFSDGAPEARAAIRAGELRWALSGFDREGWGSVSVFRADNGEEVAGARCHWSAIVKRGVTEPS